MRVFVVKGCKGVRKTQAFYNVYVITSVVKDCKGGEA